VTVLDHFAPEHPLLLHHRLDDHSEHRVSPADLLLVTPVEVEIVGPDLK